MRRAIAASVTAVLLLAGLAALLRYRSHFNSALRTQRTLDAIPGEPEQNNSSGDLSTGEPLPAHSVARLTDIFPASEGTYWIYQGVVRYGDDQDNNHAEAKVTWRMEAIRTVRRGNVVASIVKGFPGDLDWSTGDAKPQNSIVVVRDSRFYAMTRSVPDDALKRLADPNDLLENLTAEDDCLFQYPLGLGNKCGTRESVAREDGFYCWVVDRLEPVSLGDIVGLPQDIPQQVDSYSLAYRTLPDDTEIGLVPGVGIVSYKYHHHGTVADTEVKLVEFHPPEENAVRAKIR